MKTDKKKGNPALVAASLGRSAVGHVDAHSNAGLANTRTNISYDGATAPGAGGSVGTGYASGKEATGEQIKTNADYAENIAKNPTGARQKAKDDDEDLEDDEPGEDLELDEDEDDLELEDDEDEEELR